MKVSFIQVTKHGEREIWRIRNRIEPEMACPQCGYNDEVAKASWGADARGMSLIKTYPPIKAYSTHISSAVTATEIEYKCNKCEAEWLIRVEEKIK